MWANSNQILVQLRMVLGLFGPSGASWALAKLGATMVPEGDGEIELGLYSLKACTLHLWAITLALHYVFCVWKQHQKKCLCFRGTVSPHHVYSKA